MLEEYHAKLTSPQDKQLRSAIERVISIFKSRLFQALLGKFHFGVINSSTMHCFECDGGMPGRSPCWYFIDLRQDGPIGLAGPTTLDRSLATSAECRWMTHEKYSAKCKTLFSFRLLFLSMSDQSVTGCASHPAYATSDVCC